MHSGSSTPAGAIYLDRERRIENLRRMARRAADRLPTIRKVLLFGSLVSGIPTPHSDADLLIELTSSTHPLPHDRLPELLRALRPFPCPLDVFAYTTQEIEELQDGDSPLVRRALEDGVDLLQTHVDELRPAG